MNRIFKYIGVGVLVYSTFIVLLILLNPAREIIIISGLVSLFCLIILLQIIYKSNTKWTPIVEKKINNMGYKILNERCLTLAEHFKFITSELKIEPTIFIGAIPVQNFGKTFAKKIFIVEDRNNNVINLYVNFYRDSLTKRIHIENMKEIE